MDNMSYRPHFNMSQSVPYLYRLYFLQILVTPKLQRKAWSVPSRQDVRPPCYTFKAPRGSRRPSWSPSWYEENLNNMLWIQTDSHPPCEGMFFDWLGQHINKILDCKLFLFNSLVLFSRSFGLFSISGCGLIVSLLFRLKFESLLFCVRLLNKFEK